MAQMHRTLQYLVGPYIVWTIIGPQVHGIRRKRVQSPWPLVCMLYLQANEKGELEGAGKELANSRPPIKCKEPSRLSAPLRHRSTFKSQAYWHGAGYQTYLLYIHFCIGIAYSTGYFLRKVCLLESVMLRKFLTHDSKIKFVHTFTNLNVIQQMLHNVR